MFRNQVTERGVHGGCFSRTSGAGEEDQAARSGNEMEKRVERCAFETQLAEIEAAVGGIEDTDNNFFAANSGEYRHPQFNTAEFQVGSVNWLPLPSL